MQRAQETVRIVISTVFQDAGDATRAIEIALGLRKYAPADIDYDIIFISRGSRFEKKVLDLGFKIHHAEPRTKGVGERHDYKMTESNFIGDKALAKALIEGEISAYQRLRPNVVLYGFWPMAGIAYRMLEQDILGICYVPIPLTTEQMLDVIKEVPEDAPLGNLLPPPIRKAVFRMVPRAIKKRCPPLRQPNILWAARQVGWKKPLVNIFDLLKADLTIVNDFPDFYGSGGFSSDIVFTGPVFSRSEKDTCVDAPIRDIFQDSTKLRLFCTLGSSGLKGQLLEIVKAFTFGIGRNWSGVVLSPESVCPIDEARSVLGDRENVYITDKFVPAEAVNAMADIVICHGGQGTLQTAICSGTPLVGVAAQAEQFVNLANIEASGSGIHIPRSKWTAANIQKAVQQIVESERFGKAAKDLGQRMSAMDGQRNSAEAIWRAIALKRAGKASCLENVP
ncbi:nucleotide disphospho-sugar-binding domain-containing protein [Methylocystis echinoides]|uniref:glycosyltransferase n=1 Tax=Methylocystis echinoides TaxID=29468 RepID=UPI00341D8692